MGGKNDLFPIIEAVAKEKGFDLVIDASTGAVVFAQPAIDITDEVTKRYNLKTQQD